MNLLVLAAADVYTEGGLTDPNNPTRGAGTKIVSNLLAGRPWYQGVRFTDEDRKYYEDNLHESIYESMKARGYKFERTPDGEAWYVTIGPKGIIPPDDWSEFEKGYPEYRTDQPRGKDGRWSGGGGKGGPAKGPKGGRRTADRRAKEMQ